MSWHSFKIRLGLFVLFFFFIDVPRGIGILGQKHMTLMSLQYKRPRDVSCLCTKYPASDCVLCFYKKGE